MTPERGQCGFTPGPWSQGIDGNLRVYGPDGMGEHSGLVAGVFKGRANVALIAAAPDLYGVLEDFLIHISMGWELDGLIAPAQAALAKAAPDLNALPLARGE